MSMMLKKILTFILLLLPFVFGGNMPVVYPNWSENVSCTFETCYFRAEFAHVLENSNLILFNQTTSSIKFGDISNLVTLEKLYDGVVPMLSEIETPIEVDDGIWATFTEPLFSVFKVSKIDPQIFMQVGDKEFTVSEKTHTDAEFSFTPHNVTFNQTNFQEGRYFVVLQNKGTYHPVLNCTVNKLGVYDSGKLGQFQQVGNKVFYQNISRGLVTSDERMFGKPSFISTKGAFALPVMPIAPSQYSVHPDIAGCNSTGVDGVLKFYNQCNFEFSVGHFDVPINISGVVNPTFPIFHINGELHVNNFTKPDRLLFKFIDREELINTTYSFDFAETRFVESGSISATQIVYKACVSNRCGAVSIGRNLDIYKDKIVWYSRAATPAVSVQTSIPISNSTVRCLVHQANSGNNFNMTYQIRSTTANNFTANIYSSFRNGSLYFLRNMTFVNTDIITWAYVQQWDEDLCFDGNFTDAQGIAITPTMSHVDDFSNNVKILEFDMLSFGTGVGTIQISMIQMYGYDYQKKLHYNISELLPDCDQLPWFALGNPTEKIMAVRETKAINGTFRYDYLDHKNNTAAFDPDFSVSGIFELPNNGTACPYITGIHTKQTGKDKLELHYTINNICTNDTMTSVLGENKHIWTNDTCKGEVKEECKLDCTLTGTDNFIIRIVLTVGGAIKQEDFAVSYDWDSDCDVPIMCWIPYVRDIPRPWQLFIVVTVLFFIMLGCLMCVTPVVIVGQAFEKTSKGTIFILHKISWPFYFIGKCFFKCSYWMIDCYCQRYKKKKKEREASKQQEIKLSKRMINNGEETMTSSTSSKKKSSWYTACILIIMFSAALGCDNTILSQSNITLCTAGSCTIDLDVAYSLPVSKQSKMCMAFNEVETQLDTVAIEQETVNMTVVDFFMEYPLDFQYLAPWGTTFGYGTGCDCSDGTSHECEKNHHPSGSGLHGSQMFYWWTKTSGTGAGCDQLLLSGDGHYCSSYDLIHDTQVSVSAINNSPTYHLKLEVCRHDTDCEQFWHNTTQHVTHTLFSGEVEVTVNGFTVSRLPDLSGKFLIKTSGKSWVDVVNRKGDTTLSGPGFVQYYGNLTYKEWHGSDDQILKGISAKHKHCYNPAEIEYTQSYPVFYKWLTSEKDANAVLQQYGKPQIQGFAETTVLRLYPNEVPDAIGTFITKAGWMSIIISNACPVIGDITAENLFQDSTGSTLNFESYSTCGEGETVFTLTCDSGCEPQEQLRVVLTDASDIYSIHVKVTGQTAKGEICAESYFENACKSFELSTIEEEFDGGNAVITTDDKTDNEKDEEDICWTCSSDWTSWVFDTGSIWGIIESLAFVAVKLIIVIIGIALMLALLKHLFKFILSSLWGDSSSKKVK